MSEEIQNPQNLQTPPLADNDEIDLITLAKTAWNGRKTIIKVTLVFFIIGLFIAIFSPKQYSVTTVMIPQVNGGQNNLGGLFSIAAMAGFNMNMNMGSELSPMIYPLIVESTPFQYELMYTKLNFEGFDQPISYYEYFTEHAKPGVLSTIKKFTIGLPRTILSLFKQRNDKTDSHSIKNKTLNLNENILTPNSTERVLAKNLSGSVYLNVDQKNGYLSLTSILHEPIATAQLAEHAQRLLQKYITQIKIKKAQSQLKFVEERYYEKKKEFELIQEKLALFHDRNKNISTAFAKIEESGLQNSHQLAFSVYSELAKQLENSMIKVKEDTPVFSIIKPIQVPIIRIKPKRKMILMFWVFTGFVIGIGSVFSKEYFSLLKKQWKKHE